ncbi:MAG: exodeoxyribonuclease VII large subunit, partial [Clostridia bacterium]
ALKKKIELMKLRYEKCMNSRVFREPLQKINEQYIAVDMKLKRIENSIILKLKDCKTNMTNVISKLDALSPLKTLTRGYIIAQKGNTIIKSVQDIKTDEQINLRFQDGERKAKIL